MKVIRVAQVPPPSVSVDSTVMDAVRAMCHAGVGAAAVMEGKSLVGIFSERDVMFKVVAGHLDPRSTSVRQVMTSSVETMLEDEEAEEAWEVMKSRHIRHLAVVDAGKRLTGLLSMRALAQYHTKDLEDQLESLEAYLEDESPGGS